MNETPNDFRYDGPGKVNQSWNQKRGPRGAWLVGILIVAALVVTVAVIQGAYNRTRNVPVLPEARRVSSGAPAPAELSVSFREVAKAVKPAVVYISIIERENAGSQSEFFGFPRQGAPRRRQGVGSGFIVTEDGYILTNNHVVGNADKINVTLADGRKFRAEVIGTDPETDIAVIKIEAANLPYAVLANDSDEIQQGDWVLAIGSPFGLQQTLTAGIVSATGRELRDSTYNHYIQTDASINPGNSGGPLVDMQGEVVGINTMIVPGPGTGGNVGIGFAIASNTARDVFKELVKGGKMSRGYLGVMVTDLDEAKARAVGLQPNAGVFVYEVPDPESPAGKAGIREKDVITALNGKPVKAARELTETVAATPVGQTAKVDLIRDGHPQTLSVQLAERPNNLSARSVPLQGDEGGDSGQRGRLGIQGKTVTPEIAEQMKLKLKSSTGVLVTTVEPATPAAEAGVMHGDVIHSLDRAEIKTVEELAQAVKSLKSGDYLIEVERAGRTLYLTVTID